MIRRVYNMLSIALVMLAVMAVTASCGGGGLEKAVKKAFIDGDTTQASYDKICALIKENPKSYADFVTESGDINIEALGKYINEVGSSLRPPMTWDITGYGLKELTLTVYFERSGSMTPYDTPGGGGQLKKAVNYLINFFPSKEGVKINIVNDNIYPYSGSVDSFLQDRNIYESTKGTGNASYTDFKLIFEKIIQAQKPGNVSVLVTDLIYSPQNTADVSVEKILNEENSVATSIFKTYKGKSIIVNQLMGDYNGQYYPYNGAPFAYNGKRPFYLIIVADASTIDRMNGDDNFAKFLRPAGLKNSYRFNQAQSEINVKVIPDWKDNVGRFRQSRSEQNQLTNCEGDRETGILCFTLAANLKPLAKDDAFLTNAANYNVQSQSGFDITIRAIKPDDITNNNRSYLDGMTHLITAKGKFATSRDELSITLANQFPEWIKTSSSTSDINPQAADFSTTTFGLERFLQGIYDAFSAGNDSYGKIVVKLED
ncbi:MAG: hypothetical protein IJM66_03495 [Muribaculaceae bacterium]|nr:hypothetical protein [Muribaculaceae bacterium]